MDWGPRITYLASTAFKERVVPFGIKDEDRLKHLAVIGKVGSGRAELITRMALQDVERGLGLLVIDASGTVAPMLMERLRPDALARLIHVDAADAEYPFSVNFVGEFRKTEKGKALFADALATVYGVSKDPLIEFLASQTVTSSQRSVLDPFLVLTDEKERAALFPIESPDGKRLVLLHDAHKDTAATMTENGRYLTKDTMVRNLVGQREGKFSLSSVTEGSIVVVDLSRIRIFPTRIAPLIKLFVYAFRANLGPGSYAALYLHDALRYLSESDVDAMLSDQSYALTYSDTVYRETDLPLREKALARVGSVITFEPHQADVQLVERFFYPYVQPEELSGLEAGEMCVALMIDAVRAKPFFATALELPERLNVSLQDILVDSRKKYTTPRTQVDQQFKKQADKDKKDGQPPFQDAFKNIFAKRDPAKALAQGEKKPDPSRPKPETGVQEAVAGTESKEKASVVITHVPEPPQPASVAPREIPEAELRALLYVARPA